MGVLGVFLLTGLAFVAWRVWGRKKHVQDEDHLVGSQMGSASHEKTSTSTASDGSPFKSTLDQYHNPTKPVNKASNF